MSKPLTQDEIAKKLGLSRSMVYKVERAALKKLRVELMKWLDNYTKQRGIK